MNFDPVLMIVAKLGGEVEREYRQQIELLSPDEEDPELWGWYLEHDGFIIIIDLPILKIVC